MRILGMIVLWATLFCASCGPPPAPKPQPPPAPTATPDTEEKVPLGRLPNDVRPLLYDLELEIDPREEGFRGRVAIEVELSRPRKMIWIHGNGLTVSDASITPTAGAKIAATYEQVHDGGVARLTLDEEIPATTARIAMRFEGTFDARNNGLYRVKAGDEHYAFTQMEPVWTRKAFPCFDEPAFKVPFEIAVVASASHEVIANTLETASEKVGAERVRRRFARTEPLPTYLIAFAVGPLDVVEAPPIPANDAREQPLPFRGVATKGRGKELAYALAHTPAILKELETYFSSPYPYDKLDVIAVPEKGGAMENAGAVTFREWLLLLNEGSPIRQKHGFAYVMAHELAHMWFGNLVTMPWWDDIWLNEAFATWMGYRAVHAVEPRYEANVQALSRVLSAMGTDSLMSARQIRQPVTKNEHIHSAFDRITYRKGGGVLGMLERWMGAETFRKGMRRYMRKHAHGSATADDLMAVLTEAAGRDVGAPFRSFLLQPGLPNVHAELDCTGAPIVRVTQSRYLPHGSTGDENRSWQVPVCIRYGKGAASLETCQLIKEKVERVALEGACPAWVMPNAGAAGYYQWSLPPKQLQALVDEGLRSLEVTEQLSLGRAVLDMMKSGRIDAVQAARALKPLAKIEHPEVVVAPMQFIARLRKYLEGDPLQADAEALGRSWFRHGYAKLGWKPRKGEDQRSRLLRAALIRFLLHTGRDAEVRKKAAELATAYLGNGKLDPSALDANLAGPVLASFGEDIAPARFDAILEQLATTTDSAVRGHLLAALAHARETSTAQRARELTLDPRLRLNEAMTPLWVQMSSSPTRAATWSWVKNNIDPILERLPRRRAGWLPGITTTFCSSEHAEAMKGFFAPLLPKMPGGRRELDKSHELIRLCAAGKQHHLPKIRELLSASK